MTAVSQNAAASQGNAPAKPRAPRVALWDHARFAVIVLVVVAHSISTIRTDSDFSYSLYAWIYLFHMPAMILLSGVFSKADASPKAVASTVRLLGTWLLFEGIWVVIRALFGATAISKNFLVVPAWTLWFLVTLVTMRILLPYIARLRHPLIFSIVLALLGGFSPAIGTEFSVSRTLVFLPFFVLGWLAKDRGWLDGTWFQRPSAALRTAAWAVLAAAAAVFVIFPNMRNEWRIDHWLVWRDGYAKLLDGPLWQVLLEGSAIRFGLLAVAAIMTFAVLIVVPRRGGKLTVWGSRTLYVYLLHGPIIYAARETGLIDWFGSFGLAGVLALVAAAVALTALLSTGLVAKVFRPVIEPSFAWTMRR